MAWCGSEANGVTTLALPVLLSVPCNRMMDDRVEERRVEKRSGQDVITTDYIHLCVLLTAMYHADRRAYI